MKRLMVGTAFVVFLWSTKSHAQSEAVIPQADASQAPQASCVILKRMARGDHTKSRWYSLGMSGKQFLYVEGKLPAGFSLHHKMTDQDVRNLQGRGAQVLVLESDYTSADLQEARAGCGGEAGKTLDHAETKALPAPAPASIASTSTPASKPFTEKSPAPRADDSASSAGITEPAAGGPTPAPAPKPPKAKAPTGKANDFARSTGTADAALVDISSTPAGADVYIDELFFGSTPATTIILTPGDHKFAVKKDGFVVWQKKLNLPSGRTSVDAELVPRAK
ncbi:MAG TPA: PEGA domain-containing protein [Candidatus Bathyarchaeia archaeon]|jgi:hypothetical protein|nr:PEGA domain-containing protein [Candidatus Bathyarchaeia archaeon]